MNFMELAAKLSLDSSDYERGLSKAKGLATKLSSGIGKVMKVGAAAVGVATTAMVGFGASAVKVGLSFDAAMSQVAATMGKTSSEMENEVGSVNTAFGEFNGTLREFAQFMGENTKFTATEAAEALNYMALAGYNAQESMSMLPNVLNLAAAGTMDLALASDMITDTQTAFGITFERTNQLVDEMARAASTGNTNVTQLGEAFLTVGANAQELNGGMVKLKDGTMAEVDGVQELEIALTAMANAGIKGSEAGTHMRNMINKLSKPTSEGTKQLEAMGVSVFDAEGNMRSLTDVMGDFSVKLGEMTQEDRIKAIGDLFNVRDMASAKSLMNAVTGEYVKFGDQILTVDDAYQQFGEDIYDANKGFEYVQTSWDEIGEAILNASEAGVLYEGKVYSIAEAQKQFGDEIYNTAKGFKILGAAEFMALEQQNNLAGDITLLKSAFQGVQIAISDFLTPALREFVQLGTKGLSQISAALKKGDFKGAMRSIGKVISEGLTTITKGLPKAIKAGHELLSSIADGLMESMPEIVDAAVEVVSTFIQNIVSGLPDFLKSGSQILITLGQGILNALPDIRGTIKDAIDSIAEMSRNPDTLSQILEVGLEILLEIGRGISENIDSIAETVGNVIGSICDFLTEHFDELADIAIDILVSLADGIAENLDELVPKTKEVIDKIVDTLTKPENLASLTTAAVEILASLATAIIDSIATLVDKMPEVIDNVVTGISNAASGDPGMGEAGQSIVDNLIKAVERLQLSLFNLGVDIIRAILLGVKSPSGKATAKMAGQNVIDNMGDEIESTTTPETWGIHIVEGIASGMRQKESVIASAASSVASTIKGFLHFSEPDVGPLSNFHTYAPDMMMLFAQGVRDNASVVTDAVEDAFDFSDKFDYQTIGAADYGVVRDRVDSDILQILREIRDAIPDDVVLSDGTLVGWMDKALGRRAMQKARGNA